MTNSTNFIIIDSSVGAVAVPTQEVDELEEQLALLFQSKVEDQYPSLEHVPLIDREISQLPASNVNVNTVLVANRFSPELTDNRLFQQLIEQYGEERVCSVITLLGTVVQDHLRSEEFVANSYQMIKDVLEQGDMYHGYPVVVSDHSSYGGLKLVWRRELNELTPLDNTGLYQLAGQTPLTLPTTKDVFSSAQEMELVFKELKSVTPYGFRDDGCDMRCYWGSFLLENKFGYRNKKVKVDRLESKILETKPPLKFPDVRWKMHTAPVVALENGEQFVMDVALDAPMPLQEWLDCLHPRAEETSVSYADRWDLECKSYNGVTQVKPFSELQAELRALYLFEMVDGNQSVNLDGTTRRTNSWMNWMSQKTGFSPIETEASKENLIVGFSKNDDGSYTPTYETILVEVESVNEGEKKFASVALAKKYCLYKNQNKLKDVGQTL